MSPHNPTFRLLLGVTKLAGGVGESSRLDIFVAGFDKYVYFRDIQRILSGLVSHHTSRRFLSGCSLSLPEVNLNAHIFKLFGSMLLGCLGDVGIMDSGFETTDDVVWIL